MIIALGTTSADKKAILESLLDTFQIKASIEGYSVDSEITDQPLDEKTTLKGAQNRARNALFMNPGAALGIGLEGGLVNVDRDGLYLVCAAALRDGDGKEYYGISSKLKLPSSVSKSVLGGSQFGEDIRAFEQHAKNTHERELATRLITRKEAFHEALSNAFLYYLAASTK